MRDPCRVRGGERAGDLGHDAGDPAHVKLTHREQVFETLPGRPLGNDVRAIGGNMSVEHPRQPVIRHPASSTRGRDHVGCPPRIPA